jgi:uncharacterized protein YdhG (YjbR/CyaY superfamily)
MRKKGPEGSTPEKRGNGAQKTVDEYIAGVVEPGRGMLVTMRAAIRSALPQEAVETISYRMPAFKTKKVLVWFAAFKNHCSLFPTAQVIEAFRDELKGFTVSKGSVHFPLDKPVPAALIRKMVKARVEQSESRGRGTPSAG